MAKHDLFPMPNGQGYLLDVQSDLLDVFGSRVVIPVVPERLFPRPSRVLNPVVEVGGVRHVLVTQSLAAVPTASLKGAVANLSARSNELTLALDMLFQGV